MRLELCFALHATVAAVPDTNDSLAALVGQAGQVWFPDSALKTAHAMEEFDCEGLPLFILANWRGFSGGQRDLFEGVLQVVYATSPLRASVPFLHIYFHSVQLCD